MFKWIKDKWHNLWPGNWHEVETHTEYEVLEVSKDLILVNKRYMKKEKNEKTLDTRTLLSFAIKKWVPKSEIKTKDDSSSIKKEEGW